MAKFWSQMAKFWPSQNFPSIYTMIFSKKTTRVVSIPKIMKIYSDISASEISVSFIATFEDINQKHSKMAILAKMAKF